MKLNTNDIHDSSTKALPKCSFNKIAWALFKMENRTKETYRELIPTEKEIENNDKKKRKR